jgi:REP element-mobilizing transposase RayT
MFLKQDAIAELVIASLFKGVELGQYHLGAFAVMANHVHVLLLPVVGPSLLLKSLKGWTAREANRILGRTGEGFWQRESYDHWVRDDREWERICSYIEENPVKVGMAGSAEEYAWSSAHERWRGRVHTSVNAARMSACATNTGTNTGSGISTNTGISTGSGISTNTGTNTGNGTIVSTRLC